MHRATPIAAHRVGWLASNYITYVKDNTLWLETGPIDGERYNLTGGLVNDVSHGRFDSWVVAGDYRHYLRTSLRSAIALRALGYYAGGERPRPVNIGGLLGRCAAIPMYGYVAGNRVWLVNAEWRFPITDFLSIGFPFGAARFPGVQGAFFADAGRAWTPTTTGRGARSAARGSGSACPSRRRSCCGSISGIASIPGRSRRSTHCRPATSGARFVDFFFGFNY